MHLRSFAHKTWGPALILLLALFACLAPAEAQRRNRALPSRSAAELRQVLSLSDRQKAALPAEVKLACIQRYGLKRVALSQDFVARHCSTYGVEVPRECQPSHIRDQSRAGLCWVFATDNVMESRAYARAGWTPDLSEAFVQYHAWRLMARNKLGQVSRNKSMQYLGEAGDFSEGGYFTWAAQLVSQKGIVPESQMPMTHDGQSPGLVINRMRGILAEAQDKIQRVRSAGGRKKRIADKIRAIRSESMTQIDEILRTTFGEPPKTFSYRGKTYTPKSFSREVLGLKPEEYVVLGHKPTEGWTTHEVSSCLGLKGFEYHNVSMDALQTAVKNCIRSGESVWASVNFDSSNDYVVSRDRSLPAEAHGILSKAAFDYGALVPSADVSKTTRMRTGITQTNHAVAIVGFDPERSTSRVRKWKVDNSWGKGAGDGGHYHMYDDFFRDYVDEVVVPRSALPKELLQRIERAEAKKAKK